MSASKWHREVGQKPFKNPPRASQRHDLCREDGMGMGVTAGANVMLQVPGLMCHQEGKERALHCRKNKFVPLPEPP